MATIAAVAGSPSASSRTVALLGLLADRLRADDHRVDVLAVRDLPAAALLGGDPTEPAVATAVATVAAADAVILASPVYKAAYSGVLKVFLDVLPPTALTGKPVVPVLTGGGPVHSLALDYALKPVLAALGARHVLAGAFVHDSQIERTPDGAVLGAEATQQVDTALGELSAALAVQVRA